MYHPGDGHNAGTLACGGRFRVGQEHIAYRGWRRVGCGRRVIVCAATTRKCAVTTVRDSGPWGATDGERWEVQVPRLREGWRRRAVADLSRALWRRLGRPRFLSRITLVFLRD